MRSEVNIFHGVDKHLGKPWYGLSVADAGHFTYKAGVKPLTSLEVERLGNMLGTSGNYHKGQLTGLMARENGAVLHGSDSVAVVLDGRYNGKQEGYLGDMVEATRVVRPLLDTVGKIIIISPHLDIFATDDPRISLVPIPQEIPGNPRPMANPELLSYIHQVVGETPVFFPLNASTPVLLRLGEGGSVKNMDFLNFIKNAIRPGYEGYDISPNMWWNRGIHQVQALQLTASLLGIEDAADWQEFPKAYLFPSQEAQQVAQEVINIYGCFSWETAGEEPYLYLHPGIATNGRKMLNKFYPEHKWQVVLHDLAETTGVPKDVTFIEPTDDEQAAMTSRLANSAVDCGLHVAKIPMVQVKERYDWTLGSFIAFLQELSRHNGIILGCDSMPAGHAGPATGSRAVVLGSQGYNPGFYSPLENALVVMPSYGAHTSGINPKDVVWAVQQLSQ